MKHPNRLDRTPASTDGSIPSQFDANRTGLKETDPRSAPRFIPKAISETITLAGEPGAIKIHPGHSGDHSLARGFLASQGNPALDDFSHWLDDPSYEPLDRVLMRQGEQIVGHVHLTYRPMVWDHTQIPIVSLQDFVVHPEVATKNGSDSLLAYATHQAWEDGAVAAAMRWSGQLPNAFDDWVLCPSHAVTQVSARDVLSVIRTHASGSKLLDHALKTNIRMWRRVELASITQVYREAIRGLRGPILRNDPYWHWLLSRKAHDQVLVAEVSSPGGNSSAVVGYAMTQRDKI